MKNPAKPHFQVFKKVKYRKQCKPKNGLPLFCSLQKEFRAQKDDSL
ncbi:hypothetical protein LEP1GSC043_0066 [Leptospira weilii str. Ecochallenge]|uniref:Uncharacterized protein n=1 Tax=Leptospira weilii str. Ecochallenge TaxID=1049986 RepID=N1UHQ6_9LEPT|nr:hypothetical protein LEP1GSC043_0066 [Leptospira weilii str. Ecochallenge]